MLQLAPEDVPLHHRMGRIRCESVRLADPEDLWGRDLSNTTKSGLHRWGSFDRHVHYSLVTDELILIVDRVDARWENPCGLGVSRPSPSSSWRHKTQYNIYFSWELVCPKSVSVSGKEMKAFLSYPQWRTKKTVLEVNLCALWTNRHQYNCQHGEIYSDKSHPTLWLCTSGQAQSSLFCFVSSSKHCHESLLPFLLFFSRLPPLPSPFRSPRRLPPVRLWKPAVAGETKGRTWMGFPAAHSQQGRQWGRQAGSLSVSVESSVSCPPLLCCSEQRTQGGIQYNTGRQCS